MREKTTQKCLHEKILLWVAATRHIRQESKAKLKMMTENVTEELTRKNRVAYAQNLNTMLSKTSTGPVEPITVSGCPANKWYEMPQIAPLTRLSIAAYRTINEPLEHSLEQTTTWILWPWLGLGLVVSRLIWEVILRLRRESSAPKYSKFGARNSSMCCSYFDITFVSVYTV